MIVSFIVKDFFSGADSLLHSRPELENFFFGLFFFIFELFKLIFTLLSNDSFVFHGLLNNFLQLLLLPLSIVYEQVAISLVNDRKEKLIRKVFDD